MFGKFPKKALGVLLGLAIVATSLVTALPAMAAGTWQMTLTGPAHVNNGASFDITINGNVSGQARNWQTNLNYTASQMTCNSVTEGTFLSSWASAHSAVSAAAAPPSFSTATTGSTSSGPFTYYLQGGGVAGPTGTGTLAVVHFTAAAVVNGYVTITLSSDAEFGDINSVDQMLTNNSPLQSITIAVGTPLAPDLAPINVVANGTTANYTVSFAIQNLGGVDSVATTANIFVDGSTTPATTPINVPVVLANSTGGVLTSPSITISGTSDSIVVTIVPVTGETNTSNNSSAPITYIYQAAPSGKPVIVDGNIGGHLEFTPPSTISFGTMNVGNNVQTDTNMNVTGNEAWQITVQGLAPSITTSNGYDGKMTKWLPTPAPSGTYTPAVKLHAPLQIGANTPTSSGTFALDGTVQTLGSGTPEAQTNANGLFMTTTFTQNISYSDYALTNGYNYHIVVNFICTPTLY